VSVASLSSLWLSLAQVGKISFRCFYIHRVNVFPQGHVKLEKKEVTAATSEEQCSYSKLWFSRAPPLLVLGS